ncbi:hypothetical protein DVH24_017092 [Malus domestica]|uniref:Uncharacterized protein n=1 Tax=Malus domestica TaxID=3750 RepID=A0A498IS47_MALDO|nr:hypothetical protein DVH24_017092 [Malus domestica]
MPQRNLVEFICEIVVFFIPNVLLKALEAEHPIIDSNFQTNTKSSSLQENAECWVAGRGGRAHS